VFNIRLTIPAAAWLFLGFIVSGNLFADETEKRRVDISISIFPRIVAVDKSFREKTDADKKALLLFVYENDKDFAREVAARVGADGNNIGGTPIAVRVVGVNEVLPMNEIPVAIFLVEKLSHAQLEKIIAYANARSRLVFSPFSGDVERGVMVGISVTNRVQPYFNLPALKRSKVVINALLIKMSKRYE